MLKRPSSSETEEDLLALQEQFLTSKKQPSAEVRRPQTGTFFSSVDQKSRRDVVILKDTSPQSKAAATDVKSISSENKLSSTINPVYAHESYLVLKDIKESNLNQGDVPVITSHQAKYGFPIVMKLSSIEETTGKPDHVKKKSLFAQQFDSHSLDDFGLSAPIANEREVVRERVDSIQMTSHQNKPKITQDKESKFASLSSATWSNFLQSALVTGQGLVAAGATPEAAQQEIAKIHEENVSTLSALTEKDVLEEQEKLKKMLGPKIVAFLQSRSSQPSSTPSVTTEPVVKTSELDLLDQQGWLNMDVVEKEKMKWMTDVPVAMETPRVYRDVRFSLKGVVISHDIGTTIPSYLGLHHHGDEPESAGYTIEELFSLARSSFQQQRIFSLQIFSYIVKRALHNEYIDIIEGSVFDVLMESGLPILFRYALDESSDSTQAIAVTCIHSLLVSPAEEHFLHTYYCCSNGIFVPSFSPVMEARIKEDRAEDMIRYDIVKGLLGMMLLPRLRYILEVCQPQEVVVVKILEILIRVARHSLQAANEVMKCPRLINLIIEWFLPPTWSNEHGGDIYKRPHPLAMHLLYTLCIAGRYIAQELLSSYRLLSCVLQHGIVHPQDHTPLPNNDAYILSVESLRTWNVLIRYGLTTDTLSDMFPTLLKCFIAISLPFTLASCELQRTLSIFHVLSGSIHAAAVLPSMLKTEQAKEPHPPLSINWSQVRGVVDPVLKYLARILRECQDVSDEDITLDKLQYITALINIATTFYSQYKQKPELRSSPVDLLEEVESVAGNVLKLFFQSKLYLMALKTIIASLKLLTSATSSPSLPRYVPLLPSKSALYGQDSMEEKDYPCLTQSLSILTVFSDILCVSQQLCLSLIQLHHGLTQTLVPALISEEFWSHLEWFCKATPPTIQVNLCYCSLYLYLYNVVQTLLTAVESLTCYQLQLIHSCALRLVSLFPPGYEEILNKLLNNVLFNTPLYRDVLDNLTTDYDLNAPLIAAPFHSQAPPTTTADLIKVTVAKLPSIKDTYNHYCQNMGLKEKDVVRSSHWLNPNPIQQDTHLLPPLTDSLLPSNWMYWPLLIEYTAAIKGECSGRDNIGTGGVSNVLYYLVFLERCRYDVINTTPPILRLALIMSTFLIDSELFFESEIRHCLTSLFFSYTSSNILTSLNFSLPIPGLASFQDFFTSLLDQFAAVSYGDQLFASYLLIPLLQRYPLSFRKDFWIDHTHILKLIHLSPTQITIPVDSFLHPIEQDWDLLEQYLMILASHTIHPQKNSLLYLIAVHHINSFIFQDVSETDPVNELCKNLFFAVLGLPDKSLQRNLLFYNGPSLTGSSDVQLLDKFTSSQIEVITKRFSSKLPCL